MAIAGPTQQRQIYIDQLQPHVAEPTLAVGFLSTAGAVNAMVGDQMVGQAIGVVSPIAGLLVRRKRSRSRVAAIRDDLVAVTATSVALFAFPGRGGAFAVAGPPTVWSRSEVRVSADAPGRLSQRLHVQLPGGDAVDDDINRAGGDWAGFSDAVRDLLVAPVGV